MDALRACFALLLLAACGGGNSSSGEAEATPRSLAALVIQYLPTTALSAYDGHQLDRTSAVIEFGNAAMPDRLTVSLEEIDPGEADTRRRICVGCDITELDDGSTMHVTRGDRLPGVGLGATKYVRVSIFREREIVELTYEGRAIKVSGSADGPRLDVETLIEMTQDPSLGLITVQGFVDQGEDLEVWREGATQSLRR